MKFFTFLDDAYLEKDRIIKDNVEAKRLTNRLKSAIISMLKSSCPDNSPSSHKLKILLSTRYLKIFSTLYYLITQEMFEEYQGLYRMYSLKEY